MVFFPKSKEKKKFSTANQIALALLSYSDTYKGNEVEPTVGHFFR